MTVAADDTKVSAPPATPTNVNAVRVTDPRTGLNDPFTLLVTWDPAPRADGYILWVRYGADTLPETDPASTASWDRMAVLDAGTTSFRHEALNVAKTYQYKVEAFNGKGSAFSAVHVASTLIDLPLAPTGLRVVPPVSGGQVQLAWYDNADNETGFIIERQDTVNAPGIWTEVARIPTPNNGGFGGVNYTDTPGAGSFLYRVAAYNASGWSTYDTLAQPVLVQ